MQLADQVIDQTQQVQHFVRTYTEILKPDGTFTDVVNQFESEYLILAEEGWRLRQTSHRGSFTSLQSIVATYEKEAVIA